MTDAFRKVRAERITQEATGIRSFRLVAADGGRLAAAAAGSHVDVRTPGGPVRQYSLCEPGRTDSYLIAVKLEPASRGGSAAMHRLAEGDVVEISPPRNTFPLRDAENLVLIAGGIGITPVLAMGRELTAAGRPFAFHYFARSAEQAAFLPVVTTWPGTTLHLGLDPVAADAVLSTIPAGPGTRIFVCGPEPLMDAVRARAGAAEVYSERFGPAPVGDDARGCRIVLARSGITVDVGPEQSVLEAVLDAGVDVDYSCEQGTCGTCVTPVLSGEIDHRDEYLTDVERQAADRMCLCVSRGKGELRLEL